MCKPVGQRWFTVSGAFRGIAAPTEAFQKSEETETIRPAGSKEPRTSAKGLRKIVGFDTGDWFPPVTRHGNRYREVGQRPAGPARAAQDPSPRTGLRRSRKRQGSLLSNSFRRSGLSGYLGRSLLRRFRRSLFRSFLGSGLLCCSFLGAGWLRLRSFCSFERPTALRSLRDGTPASGTYLPLGFCGFRSGR